MPGKVRTSENVAVKVWWEQSVEIMQKVEHNRPDVVLDDQEKKKFTIVDLSEPCDKNVRVKEDDKTAKYS